MPKLPLLAFLLALGWIPGLGRDVHAAPAELPAAANELPAASPDESTEMARLKALPPSHIPLKDASLASAIRLLAESARMSYLAPADSDFGDRVTSDVVMNPFELLKILTEQYNVGLEYREGLWRFYRINFNELVSQAYTLRFNNLERVAIKSSSINSQLAAAGGMNNTMGGMGGGGGSSASSLASSPVFSAKTDKIIEDIKKIIGLPTVGVSTPALADSSSVPGIGSGRKPVDAPKIEPIWNPDTSELFVVATRQQHSLIAAYLKTVDQPQKMIRISVKFVETSRNPQEALGTNWSQTFLGSGGPIGLSGATLTTTGSNISNAGAATITTSNASSSSATNGGTSSSGSSTTGSGLPSLNSLATAINLNHPGNVPLPTALISAPAFQWTVQAIASDQYSSVVQDPVIYTSNNREVSFKATSQEPIQQGTTTIGSSTAATTTSIAYIDVGTEVMILPCILPGRGRNKELVQLNLSINVSAIIGTQTINGNPYPITSSRTYSYSVAVPNGETLAIAGLEQRSRQTTDNKVPIFGDIPVLSYAFKNKSDSVVHTTLLAFITPELISTDDAQAAGVTISLPPMRHRPFAGTAAESKAQIDQSLDGLPADIAALQACATKETKAMVLNRLDRIEIELELIDLRLGEMRLSKGRSAARETSLVAADRQQLESAREQVAAIKTAGG